MFNKQIICNFGCSWNSFRTYNRQWIKACKKFGKGVQCIMGRFGTTTTTMTTTKIFICTRSLAQKLIKTRKILKVKLEYWLPGRATVASGARSALNSWHQHQIEMEIGTVMEILQGRKSPGGTPRWNRRGCSSEILELTPKGDHLGVA